MVTNQWPENWDELTKGIGCPMCDPGSSDDAFGISIYSGAYSDAILQRAQIQRGYTLVIWRGRHINDLTELNPDEVAGYWQEVLKVADALLRYYEPLKMNYQILGNSIPHLHTHLLPRYHQDPAPGRVFPLPRVSANFPLIPEAQLKEEAVALQALLSTSV